jgi:hypothetical protein
MIDPITHSKYLMVAFTEVAKVVGLPVHEVAYQYSTPRVQGQMVDLIRYAVDQTMIRMQVDDVLVTNWIPVVDNDYRKALNDLVTWNIQVHDDPAASETARKRQDELLQLKNNQWPLGQRPNPCCGHSSNGVTVYGDEHSIRAVCNAFHDASTLPQFRERIQEAESRVKELELEQQITDAEESL